MGGDVSWWITAAIAWSRWMKYVYRVREGRKGRQNLFLLTHGDLSN